MEKGEIKTVITLLPWFLLLICLIVLVFIRTIWSLSICLVLNTFLVTFNTYLRGRSRKQLECFLGAIWLLLIALYFGFLGWKVGVCSFIATFFIGAVLKPFAAQLARYLLKE